ncbi:MAG: ribosome silencing factor [Armatimonadota bacterium]
MSVDSTNPKKTPSNSEEKKDMILEFADDMKAQDIEVLDVRTKTSVTDFMVVCTGTSQTHAEAVAERVAEKMRENGVKPLRRSIARQNDGWILHDYGDVVLHVMLEEKRQFYDLESLWKETETDPNLL